MVVYAVIVTYNGAKWIDKCLGSLRESTYPINIMVVDNQSTDDTVTIIKERFKEVLLFDAGGNLGFGKANNFGILKALDLGAEYILLLNQDAWLDSNVLSGLVDIHTRNNDFGILSPIHLNGNGSALDSNFSVSINTKNCPDMLSDILVNNVRDIYKVNFVMAAIWLIPRNVISLVGLFDPIFPHYGEDVDYVQRTRYHGFKIGVCPEYFGYHDRENRVPSDKRSRIMRYLGYLCVVKDLNSSFLTGVLQVFLSWIRQSMILIYQRKLYQFLLNVVDGFRILFLLPELFRNRNKFKVIVKPG